MAWSTIRKATAEDTARLETAARRFLARHATARESWLCEDETRTARERVEELLYIREGSRGDGTYYTRLWRACVRRALQSRDAEGIAYGCVGYSVA